MGEESLKEQLEQIETTRKVKAMKVKKAKLSKRQIKKGYVVVMRIDDNGNIDFEKQQVEDSTFRLKAGDYHAVNKEDILSYKGKPLVIQPSRKLMPYNPLTTEAKPLDGSNETYGQKYVMARMLKDTIKMKKNAGNIIIWVVVIAAALFGINYFLNR